MTAMKEKGFPFGVATSAKTSHTMHSSKAGCSSSPFYQHLKQQTPNKTRSPTKNTMMDDEDEEAVFLHSGKNNSLCMSELTGTSSGLKQVKLSSVKKAKAIVESSCKCSSLSAGCDQCTKDQTDQVVDKFQNDDEQSLMLKVKRQNLSENKNVKISKLLQECKAVDQIQLDQEIEKRVNQTDSRKNSQQSHFSDLNELSAIKSATKAEEQFNRRFKIDVNQN